MRCGFGGLESVETNPDINYYKFFLILKKPDIWAKKLQKPQIQQNNTKPQNKINNKNTPPKWCAPYNIISLAAEVEWCEDLFPAVGEERSCVCL